MLRITRPRAVRRLVVIGSVSVALALSGCAATPADPGGADVITLRLADGYAANHYYSIAGAQFFIDKVAELTEGQIEIEYYPGGQLGKSTDMIDVLTQGVADIAFTAPGYLPSQMPLSGAFSLPRELPDGDIGTRAYADVLSDADSAVYQTDYAANGLVPLFAGVAADYQAMSATNDLGSPDAFAGLTARSAGGTIDLIVEALGAQPVPISTGDIYSAIENGTVDANFQGPPGAVGNSLQEVVTAITTNGNFTAFVSAWTMTQEKLDSLPADLQKALLEAGEATSDNLAAVANEQTTNAMKEFEDAGATLVTYSAEDLEVLDKKLTVVAEEWTQMLGSSLPTSDAIDEMRDAVQRAAATE